MNNRDYANKVNPYYLQLANYYGRPVNTELNYNYSEGIQIVPVFKGVSYDKPNYNSLTHGSCVNYPSSDRAYIGQDCVDYRIRLDGPQGSYYQDTSKKGPSGPSGPSGPAAPTKPEHFAAPGPTRGPSSYRPAGMGGH